MKYKLKLFTIVLLLFATFQLLRAKQGRAITPAFKTKVVFLRQDPELPQDHQGLFPDEDAIESEALDEH